MEAQLRRDAEPTALLHKLHAAEQSCQDRIALLERFATLVTGRLAKHIADMLDDEAGDDESDPTVAIMQVMEKLDGPAQKVDEPAPQPQGQRQSPGRRRKPR